MKIMTLHYSRNMALNIDAACFRSYRWGEQTSSKVVQSTSLVYELTNLKQNIQVHEQYFNKITCRLITTQFLKCSKLNKHTNTHIEIYLYLINLLSACEILEMTGIGVSTIGISVSSGTTDRLRLMRERLSDTEGSEGGASISSSMDPRDRLLLRRLKQEVQVQMGKVASNSYDI